MTVSGNYFVFQSIFYSFVVPEACLYRLYIVDVKDDQQS